MESSRSLAAWYILAAVIVIGVAVALAVMQYGVFVDAHGRRMYGAVNCADCKKPINAESAWGFRGHNYCSKCGPEAVRRFNANNAVKQGSP